MKEEIMNTIHATNNTVENNNQKLNSFFTNTILYNVTLLIMIC